MTLSAQFDPLLLVMCTGNVCRSPMAEALFIHHVEKQGLRAHVISRGLAAPVGRVPHPYAVATSETHNVPISSMKRAAGVTSAEIVAATAIFIMDEGHRREMQQKFPTAVGKTFLLGQWESIEIADPINEPLPAFELAWQQCNRGIESWVARFKEAGLLKKETQPV